MLTFSALGKIQTIERTIQQHATFVAEVDTATMYIRTTRDRQIALSDVQTRAAKNALIEFVFKQVNDLLDEAADLGVAVLEEKKVWEQRRQQLLPNPNATV